MQATSNLDPVLLVLGAMFFLYPTFSGFMFMVKPNKWVRSWWSLYPQEYLVGRNVNSRSAKWFLRLVGFLMTAVCLPKAAACLVGLWDLWGPGGSTTIASQTNHLAYNPDGRISKATIGISFVAFGAIAFFYPHKCAVILPGANHSSTWAARLFGLLMIAYGVAYALIE